VKAPLRGPQLGEGVYTTLLWGAGPPPTWPLHLRRLQRDADQVGLAPPELDQLVQLIEDQLRLCPCPGLVRLRIRWWADGGEPLSQTAPRGRWELHAQPLDPNQRPGPAVALLSSGPARFPRLWAGAKVTAIGEDLAWRRRAQGQAAGEAEALLCTASGLWSETPTAALLAGLGDGRVACVASEAWPVRSTTLQALRQGELAGEITEMPLGPRDLGHLRWMALVNAVAGARSVASLDGQALELPPDNWLEAARLVTEPLR
jgi:branched-subunit amino acid aminotransferase/4-amino-4-deoxychorismate lyase